MQGEEAVEAVAEGLSRYDLSVLEDDVLGEEVRTALVQFEEGASSIGAR